METSLPINDESLCIEVTTDCNNDCSHCFVHAGSPGQSHLSVQMVEQIITEGYSIGYRQLHITGGEPLLWDGLFQSLDCAFNTGYNTVTLNTNGSLLKTDVVTDLSNYDGFSISVSLDGPEMLHDRLRKNGSYERAVSGIETALDAGINLRIFTVVRKNLLPSLPVFVNDLFSEFSDIQHITLIQLFNPSDDVSFPTKELLEPADFINLVRTVYLLNLYGLKIKIKNNPLAYIVSNLIRLPLISGAYSLYRQGSMMIRANGDISLSHSTGHRFGSYKPGMIAQVMSSADYASEAAPDKSYCPSCKYVQLCLENGMIRPSEHIMDRLAKVPYCRRVLAYLLGKTDLVQVTSLR